MRRMFTLMLSFLLIVNIAGVTAFADEAAGSEPAPAQKLYEFDGVQYINAGNNHFSSSQEEYYHSMLNNALDIRFDDGNYYSITDLWTILGMEMLAKYKGSSNLRNNLFRKETDYFMEVQNSLDENNMRVIFADPLNSSKYAPIAVVENKVEPTFKDSMWNSDTINFYFYRFSLRSAASSHAFAESVARLAASKMVKADGTSEVISDEIPVKVNEGMAPDLNGPVYFSIVGASGRDLHLFNQSPYNEKNIHAAVVAFSDFSITPIVPDENESAPYAYVKAAGGSSSKNEQKIVSDVKNYSGETVSASQTVSESVSSTVTSSINGSQGTSTTNGYSISDTVKVGAKFTLEKIFEVSEEVSTTTTENHSVTNTVSKGWSSSEGTTESETNSRTITLPLPPYTTALMSQQHFNSEQIVKYNCPVALNYKVTVYYAYGNLNSSNNQVDISFEKLTDFGSSSDARADLDKRYTQSAGSSMMADVDGIEWRDFRYDCGRMTKVLSHTVPFDTTSARFTSKIDLVRTEVDDILPIYPIDAVRFVNPDSVLYNKPWLTEVNMEVGDTDNSSNYNLRALNQYGADFYTFYKQNGSFVILDENGKDITATGNTVVQPAVDSVTGAVRFKAIGEGTVYLRYKINDGLYRTASMAASNTPEDYIDDSEISHPALLRINVTDTGHKHKWLSPKYTWSDDHSTCTAYSRCKYDDTHLKQETSDAKAVTVKTKNGTETTYTAEFETEGFETQKVTITQGRSDNSADSGSNKSSSGGTAVDKGASAAAAEKAITNAASDEGPKGTVFSRLRLRSTKQTNNSVTLKWNKPSGAVRYVIYGNRCGTSTKMKKITTVKGKSSKKITKAAGKKLQKGKHYKFMIVALDKYGKVVSTSKTVHVVTKGGKTGNYKSVSVKKAVINKAKALKKGKSLKIGAKAVKAGLKVNVHRGVRYESTNTAVATVTAKGGIVKGKKKGSCYIYAYAQNGVYKKIKVTVK